MSKLNFEFPKLSVFDDNGSPLSGGKVYFYEAGTSTMKNTFADKDGLTTNSNPVILDSRGEADVFLDRDPYKVVVTDSNDVTVLTRDNYQGYLQEDDGFGTNLLINSEARVNENGYISGSALSAGEQLFDKWECLSPGSVTFTPGGSITLAAGTRIRQENSDISALDGKEVTCFLSGSGSVTVSGLGLPSPAIISVGNPVTFTLDISLNQYIELGSGVEETYSGLTLTLGPTSTNCPRRPVLVEQFITKDYMADIVTNENTIANIISSLGVVSRAKFEYSSSNIVVTGGSYRMTSASYDKIVNISNSGISVNPGLTFGFLYILSSGITTTNEVTTASQLAFNLIPPVLNHSRNGWYNNDDRCIGVFLPDTENGVLGEFIAQGRLFMAKPESIRSYYNWNQVVGTSKSIHVMPIFTGLESVIIEAHVVAGPAAGENIELYLDSDSGYTDTNGPQLQQHGTTGSQARNSMTVELPQRPSETIYMWAIGIGTAESKYVDVYMKGYRLHELI